MTKIEELQQQLSEKEKEVEDLKSQIDIAKAEEQFGHYVGMYCVLRRFLGNVPIYGKIKFMNKTDDCYFVQMEASYSMEEIDERIEVTKTFNDSFRFYNKEDLKILAKFEFDDYHKRWLNALNENL